MLTSSLRDYVQSPSPSSPSLVAGPGTKEYRTGAPPPPTPATTTTRAMTPPAASNFFFNNSSYIDDESEGDVDIGGDGLLVVNSIHQFKNRSVKNVQKGGTVGDSSSSSNNDNSQQVVGCTPRGGTLSSSKGNIPPQVIVTSPATPPYSEPSAPATCPTTTSMLGRLQEPSRPRASSVSSSNTTTSWVQPSFLPIHRKSNAANQSVNTSFDDQYRCPKTGKPVSVNTLLPLNVSQDDYEQSAIAISFTNQSRSLSLTRTPPLGPSAAGGSPIKLSGALGGGIVEIFEDDDDDDAVIQRSEFAGLATSVRNSSLASSSSMDGGAHMAPSYRPMGSATSPCFSSYSRPSSFSFNRSGPFLLDRGPEMDDGSLSAGQHHPPGALPSSYPPNANNRRRQPQLALHKRSSSARSSSVAEMQSNEFRTSRGSSSEEDGDDGGGGDISSTTMESEQQRLMRIQLQEQEIRELIASQQRGRDVVKLRKQQAKAKKARSLWPWWLTLGRGGKGATPKGPDGGQIENSVSRSYSSSPSSGSSPPSTGGSAGTPSPILGRELLNRQQQQQHGGACGGSGVAVVGMPSKYHQHDPHYEHQGSAAATSKATHIPANVDSNDHDEFGSDVDDYTTPALGNTIMLCGGRFVWAADGSSSLVVLGLLAIFAGMFSYTCVSHLRMAAIAIAAVTSSSSPTDSSATSTTTTTSSPEGKDSSTTDLAFSQYYELRIIDLPVEVPLAGTLLLIFLNVGALFRTVLMDPGILSKHLPPRSPRAFSSSSRRGGGMKGDTHDHLLPPTFESNKPPHGQIDHLIINTVPVFMPYCPTCNIVRPPRCSHCVTCNNCVDRFDHHCGIIGACIGRRNMRPFLWFVFSTTFSCVWVFMWSIILAYAVWNVESATTEKAFIIINIVTMSIVGSLLVNLTQRYIRLVVGGFTMREFHKKETLYPVGVNPFDEGALKNCQEVCYL